MSYKVKFFSAKAAGQGLLPHSHKLLFVELGVNRGVGNGCVTEIDLYGPYVVAVVYHKGADPDNL